MLNDMLPFQFDEICLTRLKTQGSIRFNLTLFSFGVPPSGGSGETLRIGRLKAQLRTVSQL
jgi:hypothetical protein